MWELIDQGLGEMSGAKKGEVLAKFSKEVTLLGRVSVPEDVVGVVSFLAGPDSDFMTGQTVVVDGGIVFA